MRRNIARTHFIILIAAMQTDAHLSVLRYESIVGRAISVCEAYGTLVRTEQTFGGQDQGVIETAADDEWGSDLNGLIGVVGPIGLELL